MSDHTPVCRKCSRDHLCRECRQLMNDADAVWAAIGRLRHLKERGEESVSELTLETLTALTDRLETHALVPREPTEAMLTAIREAHWESCGCQFAPEDYCAAYRAMLTASEAK